MPATPDDRLVSVNRAAELFGKDRRTVRKALANTPIAGSKGRAQLYTFDSIGRALYGSETQAEVDQESVAELRRRLLLMEVGTAELDYEERLGNVGDISGVASAAIEEGHRIRDTLMRVPSRVSPEFAAEDSEHTIKMRLEEELRNALEDLSSTEDLPDADDDED